VHLPLSAIPNSCTKKSTISRRWASFSSCSWPGWKSSSTRCCSPAGRHCGAARWRRRAAAAGAIAVLPFGYTDQAAWFIGIILTATSVSISAQTLLELVCSETREGITLLGAAVVDDVLVLIVLSIFLALGGSAAGEGSVIVVVAKMFGYLALSAALGWFVLPGIVKWVDRQPISEGLTAVVLFITLVFAWSAEVMGGLAAITGAFIAGVDWAAATCATRSSPRCASSLTGFWCRFSS